MQWLVGVFLIAHGLVHLAIWLSPVKPDAPFNPAHSWFFSAIGLANVARAVAILLAVLAGAGQVLGGIGWLVAGAWAKGAVVWSASISLALILLYLHPWFIPVTVINVAILYALRRP